MTMRNLAVALLITICPAAVAQLDARTAAADAERIAARYTRLAGSEENALALVLALHSGEPVRLIDEAPSAGATAEMITFESPTGPLEWVHVRATLASAQQALARAGVTRPTPQQLQAALLGGELASPAGEPIMLPGVLRLHADGISGRALSPP